MPNTLTQTSPRMAELSANDLKDLVSFKSWLSAQLHLDSNLEISKDNLLIYLNYVEDCIKEQSNIDHQFWLKLINDLIMTASSFKRVK